MLASPDPRQPQRAFSVAYELWCGSWDAALVALASATRNRLIGSREAEAHKAVIAVERELINRQFTVLL